MDMSIIDLWHLGIILGFHVFGVGFLYGMIFIFWRFPLLSGANENLLSDERKYHDDISYHSQGETLPEACILSLRDILLTIK